MSQISQIEARMDAALEAVRKRLGSGGGSAPAMTDDALAARVAALEAENAALLDEMERLREKRDKDVAALDELISQLKPLIEEV